MGRRPALRRMLQAGLWMVGGGSGLAVAREGVTAGRTLAFPSDFGAHPDTHIEWWYATGVLHSPQPAQTFGFQVTFFRNRTSLAPSPSRFSAQQLLFAHAAVTDLSQQRLRHDQRLARQGFERAQAGEGDTQLRIGSWHLEREGPVARSLYRTEVDSPGAGFQLALTLQCTQPILLQGQAGFSRKGPQAAQASHYYSQPQLEVRGTLSVAGGPALAVTGRAWLDHEWSDALLDAEAVGWDWIGMNLGDGSALTAFRLRRADDSVVWAGGSWRPPGGAVRDFAPSEVSFTPVRHWLSPRSRGRYPVQCRVHTPVGSFEIRALLDDQELDSQQSSGAIYWEGLSECRDASGQVVGQGYLEMTGYAARLRL